MHVLRPIPAIALLAIAVSACSSSSPPGAVHATTAVTHTQEADTNPGGPKTAGPGASGGPAATTPRGGTQFIPASYTCRPSRPAQVNGVWQSSAPRMPFPAGQVVKVGLRNSAPGIHHTTVSAVIYLRGHKIGSATAKVVDQAWLFLRFPVAFQAKAPRAGTYTIIWETPAKRFITCDGFVIR